MQKLLIFIVAYNADSTLKDVIHRIPRSLLDGDSWNTEILIIDDASKDSTFDVGRELKATHTTLTILKNPENQGYGGNQKLGYRYAVDQGFDVVALVHGDGQYAPEKLLELLQPFADDPTTAAVFGSRMLVPGDARAGGMPLYKQLGNKTLSYLQNKIAGTELSEFHSGYRLYSCKALKKIPFERNSNEFDFDTDIILQLHGSGQHIIEVPIPTHYGDEVCHVNGVRYAIQILKTTLRYNLQQKGIFYQSKFDFETENTHYQAKYDFLSSHSLALDAVKPEQRVFSIGSGPAELVKPFVDKGASVTALDWYASPELKKICTNTHQSDVDDFDYELLNKDESYQRVLALDIIEHLKNPEYFVEKLRHTRALADAEFVITTANVTFLPIRLMFLLGSFNYGKRGILDKTHTRLFTFNSLRSLLESYGFEILDEQGIPAPFPLAFGRNSFANLLLKLNRFAIAISKGAFSYQIYVRARALPTVERLLERSIRHTNRLEQEALSENQATRA